MSERTPEQERLWAEHRARVQGIEDAKATLAAWQLEYANALGRYPVGTEVVWLRANPTYGGSMFQGGVWGTVCGYHFAEWGSLVAEILVGAGSTYQHVDNDSRGSAMPGYHYGTRAEYRAMLERELRAAAPSLPEPRPNER